MDLKEKLKEYRTNSGMTQLQLSKKWVYQELV